MTVLYPNLCYNEVAVNEFVFNITQAAEVIEWRCSHGLESHPKDWRSWGSNSGPLGTKRVVYLLHQSDSSI